MMYTEIRGKSAQGLNRHACFLFVSVALMCKVHDKPAVEHRSVQMLDKNGNVP